MFHGDCDKHVVNSSTDNHHFICEQKDSLRVFKILDHLQ